MFPYRFPAAQQPLPVAVGHALLLLPNSPGFIPHSALSIQHLNATAFTIQRPFLFLLYDLYSQLGNINIVGVKNIIGSIYQEMAVKRRVTC